MPATHELEVHILLLEMPERAHVPAASVVAAAAAALAAEAASPLAGNHRVNGRKLLQAASTPAGAPSRLLPNPVIAPGKPPAPGVAAQRNKLGPSGILVMLRHANRPFTKCLTLREQVHVYLSIT